MESIELTRFFVRVVEKGSFSRAAEFLKVPKSTVSKSITRLEKETGTQLLVRTTRSLTLTAAGRAFYDACLGPIQILEDARKSLHGQDSMLSGTVRITAPEDLGAYVISPAIGELVTKNPALNFELHYTDEIVDLVKDGFDLAVRIGRLQESSLRARKAAEILLILVASPQYLRKSPKIKTPSELASHNCLTISARSPVWRLRSKGANELVKLKPRIVSNQMTSLMNMCSAGAGVALIPAYLCREEIERGELEQVLPDWVSPGLNVSLISPIPSAASVRLKVTMDHLALSLKKALG